MHLRRKNLVTEDLMACKETDLLICKETEGGTKREDLFQVVDSFMIKKEISE